MLPAPAYQSLFDELLEFSTGPRFEDELAAARAEYFSLTGEVFDEDRSFGVRMQAFLDWYVFDRPLAPFGEPVTRAYAIDTKAPAQQAQRWRIFGRTTHGVFAVESVTALQVVVENLATAARYDVELPAPLAGVALGDLFEGRLVPYEGRRLFSSAFLFHPSHVRRRVEKEIERQRAEHVAEPVQSLVWTLSRMASRAEHYRNFPIDAIYDFSRPPPIVAANRMKFDRESVERRLGRVLPSET